MSFLELQSITKRYGPVSALDGVDLRVEAGCRMAIIGPSGSGKTSLLRIVAGFEAPDAGRVILDGQVLAEGPAAVPAYKRGIGVVAQDGALFPHLSVFDNIGFGLERNTSNRDARILQLMDTVELDRAMQTRRPHELSGGQQQRVALARALARQPKLMLLDEPFNALDLDLRRSMCEEIVALLKRAGATVLLVTHDPGEAFATSDLVAVMQSGQVMQCAKPDVVYHEPASPTVARLTGAAIFLDGKVGESGSAIETPLGILPLRQRISDGRSAATAMLRPEQIALVQSGEGRQATVIDRRFRGDHTALTVTGDGFHLTLRANGHVSTAGDVVYLGVKGGCVAFADEKVRR